VINVQNEQDYPLDAAQLLWAAETVLRQHDQPGALSIVVTDNTTVQGMNRQFRGIDAPTDVLSFPADFPLVDEEDDVPYLGDLVIAYPYAQHQAEREGHDLQLSLMLLVVHGTLHLLDYDHDTPARRAEMWAAQDRALDVLHIPLSVVPALEDYDE
jgi:probable rRNA maturation factor